MPDPITLDQLLDRATGLPHMQQWLLEQSASPTLYIYLDRFLDMWVKDALGPAWSVCGMDIHGPNETCEQARFPEWLDRVRRGVQDLWRRYRQEACHPTTILQYAVNYTFNEPPPKLEVGGTVTVIGNTGATFNGRVIDIGKGRVVLRTTSLQPRTISFAWSNLIYKPDGTYLIEESVCKPYQSREESPMSHPPTHASPVDAAITALRQGHITALEALRVLIAAHAAAQQHPSPQGARE